MLVVVVTILRWLLHASTTTNLQLAAVGTLLLWMRVIQYVPPDSTLLALKKLWYLLFADLLYPMDAVCRYLNGIESTAAYGALLVTL